MLDKTFLLCMHVSQSSPPVCWNRLRSVLGYCSSVRRSRSFPHRPTSRLSSWGPGLSRNPSGNPSPGEPLEGGRWWSIKETVTWRRNKKQDWIVDRFQQNRRRLPSGCSKPSTKYSHSTAKSFSQRLCFEKTFRHQTNIHESISVSILYFKMNRHHTAEILQHGASI